MKLKGIIKRKLPPGPWEEGEKIPWNDPLFSERMLEKTGFSRIRRFDHMGESGTEFKEKFLVFAGEKGL
jgi:hypothetical protein